MRKTENMQKDMRVWSVLLFYLFTFLPLQAADIIPQGTMQRIFDEVRTPYKYGLVVAPTDNYHKIDCPTVFQHDGKWYMTYVVYNGKDGTDGRGYETWLSSSDDLLHWTTLGRILSYKDDGWDMNQRGGFPALIDWTWDGDYGISKYKKYYWMTYIGGHGTGYEAVREPLNIGMAWTQNDLTQAHEWQSGDKPLLSINDKDVQWWEKLVQYKSTIYSLTPSPSPKGERSEYSQVADTARKDTTPLSTRRGAGGEAPIVFDNVALEKMLSQIASYYNKEVEFQNDNARQFRFYFVWKPDEGLDVTLHRLNLFESVSVELNSDKIVVE